MMRRAFVAGLTLLGVGLVGVAVTESPVSAGHVHYVETPNGKCHQVAQGQTSISDSSHGGYHRYHEHVHVGATGDDTTAEKDNLGKGNGRAKVHKEGPAPPHCDGS